MCCNVLQCVAVCELSAALCVLSAALCFAMCCSVCIERCIVSLRAACAVHAWDASSSALPVLCIVDMVCVVVMYGHGVHSSHV